MKILKLEEGNLFTRVYAGNLDAVNGFDEARTFERTLKFQALFYEHILIPDGFFHCHGPISHSIRNSVESGSNPKETPLLRFLEAGIAVPMLRSGSSLLDNFRNEEGGILMAKARNPAYSSVLSSLFIGSKSNPAKYSKEILAHFVKLDKKADSEWRSLLEAFCAVVQEQGTSGYFRRGLLEEVVVKQLQIKFSDVYESVLPSAMLKNCTDSTRRLARYLLAVTGTIYEGYQADQFHAVGDLFPRFEADVIDANYYSRLKKLFEETPRLQAPPLSHDMFDPTKIEVEKIIEFRKTRVFQRHLELLRGLRQQHKGESLREANPAFCAFLENTYSKKLITLFPEAIDSEQLKLGAAFVTYIGVPLLALRVKPLHNWLEEGATLRGTAAVLLVFGIPILSSVSRITEKSAKLVAEGLTKLWNAVELRRFRAKLNRFSARTED